MLTLPVLKEAEAKATKLDPFALAVALRRSALLKPVSTYSPMLGGDPEFFFQSGKGDTVGAEKVLPKDGLARADQVFREGDRPYGYTNAQWEKYKKDNTSKFIIDGAAVEINMRPNGCRGYLGNEIIHLMRTLKQALQMNKGSVKTDFSAVVQLSEEEIKSLDEKNRVFGCAPSSNAYNATAKIEADPEKYLKRGAGGHIHLGIGRPWENKAGTKHPPVEELVWLLDTIVGNTFVLLDRDEANIERRKNYGRAGEYRLPEHGLEYRTLSNVWLRGIPLFSLAFGLARQAVEIYMDQTLNGAAIRKALRDVTVTEDVVNAINNNDFDLALKNYIKIEPIICATAIESGHHTITRVNASNFVHFVTMIYHHGLSYWFKEDPLEHWCNCPDSHNLGIYSYLNTVVKADMEKQEKHPVLAVAEKKSA